MPSDDLSKLTESWPDPDLAAIGVTTPARTRGVGGDTTRISNVASISKLVVALTALVALEEGTIALDEPAGPPGATVRHLLAHASGLGFNLGDPSAPVGERRVYSNAGIEAFADHLTHRAGMPFADYQHEAVIVPLGLANTTLNGSPAHGIHSNVDDLLLLARELLAPRLVHPDTLALATSVHFEDLAGVLPGFGSFRPNPWGLAIEIKGTKSPHWTAPEHGPEVFGHFGGSGTFLWVDPTTTLAAVAISGTPYGPWANDAWPVVNHHIHETYRPPAHP